MFITRHRCNDLQGTTRINGYKVTLYAIYNDGLTNNGTDKQLSLNVTLQDCSCCGAYTNAAHTQWLSFMCHNLGANETLDPFTPSQYIHGAKYQFGLQAAKLDQATDQANTGSVSNWTTPSPPSSGNWDMTTANPCPAGWRYFNSGIPQ